MDLTTVSGRFRADRNWKTFSGQLMDRRLQTAENTWSHKAKYWWELTDEQNRCRCEAYRGIGIRRPWESVSSKLRWGMVRRGSVKLLSKVLMTRKVFHLETDVIGAYLLDVCRGGAPAGSIWCCGREEEGQEVPSLLIHHHHLCKQHNFCSTTYLRTSITPMFPF